MGDVSLQGNHNQNLNAVEMTSLSSSRKDSARPDVLPTDEKAPLQPNRTFYIVPHTGFTKAIQVLDLTPQIKERVSVPLGLFAFFDLALYTWIMANFGSLIKLLSHDTNLLADPLQWLHRRL